jgi:7-cyano-7-deazaguanine synthase
MSRAIILLSGGLDSLVSLGLSQGVELALTFDYGQKAAQAEISASKKICEYYGVAHRVIELNWLKEITHTALVGAQELPSGIDSPVESAKAVWVPNRNGLFLNIAAAFADANEQEQDYDRIIIGANKEEAQTFPDNTREFIDRINAEFEFSTLKKPKVEAPLIDLDKKEIVKKALEAGIPLELAMSCYNGTNCGVCESCVRFNNAITASSPG